MTVFTSTYKSVAHGALNWDTQLQNDFIALEGSLNNSTGVNGGDWNTVLDPGTFFGATMANSPDGTTSSFGVWVIRRGPTYTAQLAIRLDPTVGAMYRRVQNNGTWSAWVRITDASLDTGWVTASTGIAAATGWTLANAKYRVNNGVATIGFTATRTGAALAAASAAGIVTKTAVATVPAALTPSTTNSAWSATGQSSTYAGSGHIDSGGIVQLTLGPASAALGTNAVLDVYATYSL